MIILGIETSCDETSASLVKQHPQGNLEIISQVVATSLSLHATTGGIIPENAAREQLKYMIPVVQEAIHTLAKPEESIDAIAVTVGPGLIGSLLIGVETAKTLSLLWKKPIIPVNHLFGHIYANWLTNTEIVFPALALVVSGNHTDLVLMKSHTSIRVLGSTRDDAAGEAFDKIGRLLGLSYPAGPTISHLALKGDSKLYQFPRPMMYSKDYDFSFSGLKTAVLRQVKEIKTLKSKTIADICASTQEAIVEVLVYKTIKSAKKYGVKSLLLGGGVAANETLRVKMQRALTDMHMDTTFFVPDRSLCTDNASMIAAAAFFKKETQPIEKITVDPELYY